MPGRRFFRVGDGFHLHEGQSECGEDDICKKE